jgi:tetratricopeptide (TPR) repeat protein
LTVVVLVASNLQVQAEEKRTAEQRERAEANLHKARDMVDRMFTRVAQDLTAVPRMEPIRRALLEDALEFYKGFLKEQDSDAVVRRETARASMRVGEIHVLLGRHHEAERPYVEAIALLEKLAGEDPSRVECRLDLGQSFHELARIHIFLGRPDKSLEERRAELDLCEKLASEFPNVPDYRRLLAKAHTDLGIALEEKRPHEAEEHFRLALITWDRRRADFLGIPEDGDGLAYSHYFLGTFLLHTDRLPEAEQELRRSLALREHSLADEPHRLARKAALAHIQDHLALVLARRGKFADAEGYSRQSIRHYETLLEDFPNTYDFSRRLERVYTTLGSSLLALGRVQEAEASLLGMGRVQEAEDALRRSLSLWSKLVADHPDEHYWLWELGLNYNRLGNLLQATGRRLEAADAFRRVTELFKKAAAQTPPQSTFHLRLAWFRATCPAPQFCNPAGAVEAAMQTLQHAPLWKESWQYLGVAQYRYRDWNGAIEALRASTRFPSGADGVDGFFLAMAHWQLGKKDEARKWYDRAVRWMDKNTLWDDELRRFRAEAEELLQIKGKTSPETKKRPR